MAHILIAEFQDNCMVKNSCKQINLQKTIEIEQVLCPHSTLKVLEIIFAVLQTL